MIKVVDTRNLTNIELQQKLTKPSFDEVVVNPKITARNAEIFGRPLTAAQVVETILKDVRTKGDVALIDYTKRIDGVDLTGALEVTEAEMAEACASLDPKVREALKKAAANVRRFHEEQLPKSWLTKREKGSLLGQLCLPLERVGIYVPGGTANYPSSVLMNGIPAKVAGVEEIIMVVPPAKDGSVPAAVLAAAQEAGVNRIFKLGGAQAIGALAYGTVSVPKVDKITGPGNLFVTLAKKAVYGHCDIDMLAGPSEILIVADKTADPAYVAADLLSQAEHDALASAILVTDSAELIEAVQKEVKQQLAQLPRYEIAQAALENQSMILLTTDLKQAMVIANLAAPEHLEILTEKPFELLPEVRHAGAVFLGAYSPEPLGDYLAGPNHVLPTGGTARFYSVLNVETFMKRTSIISYTKEALADVEADIISLAETEGLTAHANAIRVRGQK